MPHFKFASIAHSSKYGYAFDSSSYSNSESHSESHPNFRQFETYGDGLTQHSGDWSVTLEYLTDYLQSLGAAMLTNEELTDAVSFLVTRHPDADKIAFAASVVYKDSDGEWSKRRYYSSQLQKVGGRAKEHDNRFTELTRYQDGSRASIFRIVTLEYAYGLERFQNDEAIRDWAFAQKKFVEIGEGLPKWFDGNNRKLCKLRDALSVCRLLAEALRNRNNAESMLNHYKHCVSVEAAQAAESETVIDILAS